MRFKTRRISHEWSGLSQSMCADHSLHLIWADTMSGVAEELGATQTLQIIYKKIKNTEITVSFFFFLKKQWIKHWDIYFKILMNLISQLLEDEIAIENTIQSIKRVHE